MIFNAIKCNPYAEGTHKHNHKTIIKKKKKIFFVENEHDASETELIATEKIAILFDGREAASIVAHLFSNNQIFNGHTNRALILIIILTLYTNN